MGRLMEQTIEEKQMDEGAIFAKEHIVELAKLIVDWQDSGLLGGGTHCLVDDLCNMLPSDSEIIKLRLAESIIKDICLQMVAFSTSEAIKKNLIQEKFRQEKFNKAFNDILKGSRQMYLYCIIDEKYVKKFEIFVSASLVTLVFYIAGLSIVNPHYDNKIEKYNPTQIIKLKSEILLIGNSIYISSKELKDYTLDNPKLCRNRYVNIFNNKVVETWYICE